MDHGSAIDSQTAERYLLGELSAGEAEDFERHYFDCPQCALAVSSGEAFIANVRAVFLETDAAPAQARAPAKTRASFWSAIGEFWPRAATALPLAAAVLFAALAVYQGAVLLPGMRQALQSARPLPAFELVGGSRGDVTRIAVTPGTPSFSVAADLPPDVRYSQYRCTLTAGGRTVFRVVSPAPADGRPITILVPVRGLKPGSYELSISGIGADGRESEPALKYPFDFRLN